MPIADFEPKRTTVKYAGGEFAVRAVSLTDVAQIIEIHEGAVDRIYATIKRHVDAGNEFTSQIASDITIEIIRESPGLVAQVIAIAAGEYDQASKVLQMPVTVQMDALTAIGTLTFSDLAGAKKFAANVMNLIRGLYPAANVALVKAA